MKQEIAGQAARYGTSINDTSHDGRLAIPVSTQRFAMDQLNYNGDCSMRISSQVSLLTWATLRWSCALVRRRLDLIQSALIIRPMNRCSHVPRPSASCPKSNIWREDILKEKHRRDVPHDRGQDDPAIRFTASRFNSINGNALAMPNNWIEITAIVTAIAHG